MSFIKCINNAVAEGIIPDSKKNQLTKMLDENIEKYVGLGDDLKTAEAKAAKDTYFAFTVEAANKQRQALLQSKKDTEAITYMFETYRDKDGNINPGEAMQRIIGFMETAEGTQKYLNVETRIRAVKGEIDGKFYDVLLQNRHTILGNTRNQANMHNMGRELFNPGSTKNINAQQMADGWRQAAELARIKYNAAGGSIPKMDDWRIPQNHDQIKVALKGMDDWVTNIMPLLDRDKMINYQTGLKFTDADLKVALDEVWNNISTKGYLTRTKGQGYGSKLANQRLDHRFLHFKDYDSWLKYNEEFGSSDLFNTMLAHLDSMSRDIALMEVMGPNPDAFMRTLKFEATKWANTQPAAKKVKAINKIKSSINTTDAMYLYVKGDTSIPVSETVAKFGASFRNIATASYLGSAAFLALGDFNLTRATAAFTGLNQWQTVSSNLKTFVSPLSGMDNNTRIKIAATSGLASEHWSTLASGAARMSADRVASHEFSRRLSDFILRTTQLSWLTQAGRFGAGMEFLAFTARSTNMSFRQMRKTNNRFVDYLESYGITEKDWDIIRQTKKFDGGEYDPNWKGAEYLRPDDIAARTDIDPELAQQLSLKYNHAMQEFVNFAVPVANARGATFGSNVTRPGTLVGEFLRGVMQFKQFPLTFAYTHIARGLGRKTLPGKLGYLAPLLVSTTLMGILSHELKNIVKGKNISVDERVDDPSYWIDAMLHGGGLGFAGDIIFGGRYSHDSVAGRGAELIGPTAGFAFAFLDLTAGNIYQAAKGDDINLGADLTKFIKNNAPGSSAWYMRLLLERYLFEYMQEISDPKYKSKIRRKIKQTKKKEKNTYWWKPGDKAPSRTPGIN